VVYYVMREWLEAFSYRIPLSWWMFVTGGIVGLFITIIAVSYQSLRAGLANPVNSLRSE
jgi:putative ABC transport system permease protein